MTKEEAQKRIEVMQAYVDGKTIEFYNDDLWIETQDPTFFRNVKYRVKPEVVEHHAEPTSWEEFCKTTRIHDGEAYVDSTSHILECGSGDPRNNKEDANLYPSKELAEAALAQAQLLQLRRAYVGDWEPDWTDSHKTKYCIVNGLYGVRVNNRYSTQRWLSFPDNEMAERFLSNFRDLIETVKPLL